MVKKIIAVISFFLPSPCTLFLYRLCGYTIGRNTKLPIFSYIYANIIKLGNDVDIRPLVFINVNELVIGNNTIVSYGTQIKGEGNFLTKDNCFLGPHCIIHCEEDVQFGFYSGLGPRCTIYTHGSFLPVTQGYPAKFEKVIIEDYVWIAMSVCILSGAHIESNCIINPSVVIHSRIKSNSLVQVKPDIYTNMDIQKLCKFSRKSNQVYHERIITEFLTQCNATFEHNTGERIFNVKGSYYFSYDPKTNIITLSLSEKKKIAYDLDNFYVDYSTNKIHKAFLFFLRRKYGLTLRTRYLSD